MAATSVIVEGIQDLLWDVAPLLRGRTEAWFVIERRQVVRTDAPTLLDEDGDSLGEGFYRATWDREGREVRVGWKQAELGKVVIRVSAARNVGEMAWKRFEREAGQ
jgi:hypothetical protein